jgi:SAM-dependent methyltransferase
VASDIESFYPGSLGIKEFDVITMWFVIEHLKELPQLLIKINSILSQGGVFAFSTPNYNGISRLRNRSNFMESNPLDHYTIWSPLSARRLLKKYGFRIKAVKCPTIHPERFFPADVYKRLPSPVKALIRRLVTAAGKLLLLGDTFEVYAVKKKNSGVNK